MKKFRVNQEIRTSPLRVIDFNGKQLGIMSREEALRKAEEYNLDLVEVVPNAEPPVVKIMDFGKFKYEQSKASRKQKSKQKSGDVKEIRLSIKISEHDLKIKAKQAENFLKSKDKVKVILKFKGREITHKELGIKILENFAKELEEFSKIEEGIKQQGMTMSIVLVAK